jgi:hypothetical protein
MKRREKRVLIVMLSAIAGCLVLAPFVGRPDRLLNTAGQLFTLSALVQLQISGFFEAVVREFSDDEKHPYGLPSRYARELVTTDDPPLRWRIQEWLFLDSSTSAIWFVAAGAVLQIIAVWMPSA